MKYGKINTAVPSYYLAELLSADMSRCMHCHEGYHSSRRGDFGVDLSNGLVRHTLCWRERREMEN